MAKQTEPQSQVQAPEIATVEEALKLLEERDRSLDEKSKILDEQISRFESRMAAANAEKPKPPDPVKDWGMRWISYTTYGLNPRTQKEEHYATGEWVHGDHPCKYERIQIDPYTSRDYFRPVRIGEKIGPGDNWRFARDLKMESEGLVKGGISIDQNSIKRLRVDEKGNVVEA